MFAALRDVGVEPDYVGRFEDDHQRIEERLASAAGERRVRRPLIALVEDHILREETDLFRAARQLLARISGTPSITASPKRADVDRRRG